MATRSIGFAALCALTWVFASAGPVQADEKCKDSAFASGAPIVRDHRDDANKPVIRDHRPCPVVRDHRRACYATFHTVSDISRWTDANRMKDWCDVPTNYKIGHHCTCAETIDGKFPTEVVGKTVNHTVIPAATPY